MASALDQGPVIHWESGPELVYKYKLWKQKCMTMFDGPMRATDEDVKCKYLLLWSGDRGFDLFNSWNMSDEDSKLLDKYWEKFEEYVTLQTNFLMPRYKLHKMRQEI